MPDPFITVQDLSDALGRDLSTDDGAVLVIDSACDICRTISGRSFNAGTTTISLDGPGTDALLLPQWPVTVAGTVTVNGVAETEFMVTETGALLRGTAGVFPRPVWPQGRQNVVVSYQWGFAEGVPRDVRQVALNLAQRAVVQGVARSETVGDVSTTYAVNASDLDANELRILRMYRAVRSY